MEADISQDMEDIEDTGDTVFQVPITYLSTGIKAMMFKNFEMFHANGENYIEVHGCDSIDTLNIQKASNRDIAEFILSHLKCNGFEVYDVTYLDGYFLFETGEDSVVHFKVQGIKGWKFGIWIDKDSEKAVAQIFGQVIANIDKFKPSRSWAVFEVNQQELSEQDTYKKSINDFIDRLHFIKAHPIIAHVNDLYNEDFYANSYLAAYISDLKWNVTRNIRTIFKCWAAKKTGELFGFVVRRFKYVDHTSLVDENDGGFIVSPRYSLNVFLTLSEDDETALERVGYFISRKFSEIDIGFYTLDDYKED